MTEPFPYFTAAEGFGEGLSSSILEWLETGAPWELVETGFSARESARVVEMISELGRIETETDELQDRACRVLFEMEEELGVATVYWDTWHRPRPGPGPLPALGWRCRWLNV